MPELIAAIAIAAFIAAVAISVAGKAKRRSGGGDRAMNDRSEQD